MPSSGGPSSAIRQVVVSNTTPISELAKVGRLGLLQAVYQSVTIATQVQNELMAGSHPAQQIVTSASWLHVRPVRNAQSVPSIQAATGLGPGECATIALGTELQADYVLLDDWAAREEAKSRSLRVIGTVGTLLIAKQLGIVSSVKEVLDDLRAHGMRIGRRFYLEALQAAGE